MAKGLNLIFDGKESVFDLSSIDRADIYGKRRRIALDADGQPCVRVSMLPNGSLTLKSGMTGQGYFLSDGTYLKQAELEGFTVSGEKLDKTPSTLGNPTALIGPVDPQELLDLRVSSIYLLAAETLDNALKSALDKGSIFKFTFTYRDSYETSDAFIISNKEGIFMLSGTPNTYEWCSLDAISNLPPADDADDDDLDFDML